MLPTSGTARFSSPLGVYDFVKRSSLIEVSEAGAQVLGPIAAELAYGEGLQAHARAAELRLNGSATPAPLPPVAFSVRPVEQRQRRRGAEAAGGARPAHAGGHPRASLAQVAYEPKPAARLRCSTATKPVGMMLLYDARLDKERPASQLYVWRLMVDAHHQKRGYGRLAMQWVVEEARRWGVQEVGLSHVMRDGHAGGFYAKLGFTYTGNIEDGEHKMVLKVD